MECVAGLHLGQDATPCSSSERGEDVLARVVGQRLAEGALDNEARERSPDVGVLAEGARPRVQKVVAESSARRPA